MLGNTFTVMNREKLKNPFNCQK